MGPGRLPPVPGFGAPGAHCPRDVPHRLGLLRGFRRMSLTFFKRYRMEIDLVGRDLSGPKVPAPYRLLPWDD